MKIEVKPIIVGFVLGYFIQVGVGALVSTIEESLTIAVIIAFLGYVAATFAAAYLAKQQAFYHAFLAGIILALSGIPTEGFNLIFLVFEIIIAFIVARLTTTVATRFRSS